MWKIHLIVSSISLLLALVQADYTITASNEVGSYHYPAPPKSQQLLDPVEARQSVYAVPQAYQNQYQNQANYYTPAFAQQSAVLTKQFASPALENAAFNLALTNQGYTFGNVNTPQFNAALMVGGARASKPTLPKTTLTSSATPVIGSLNVKLPLPIGVTPLNIGPLPLQAGTPYAKIPKGVTSYGTPYPQRKRR